MKEPVVVVMEPLRKRSHNKSLPAPGLAEVTLTDMSRVRGELRELTDEVGAIVPPVPTSLCETHLRHCHSLSIGAANVRRPTYTLLHDSTLSAFPDFTLSAFPSIKFHLCLAPVAFLFIPFALFYRPV